MIPKMSDFFCSSVYNVIKRTSHIQEMSFVQLTQLYLTYSSSVIRSIDNYI